jgi:hypothetical protein
MRNRHSAAQAPTPEAIALRVEVSFATLLYRFIFFDWLFADLSKARNLFERNAAWQHNRNMRRHLPVYFWRWLILTLLAFGSGALAEHWLETTLMAAWCFTWSSLTLSGMVVIGVLWLFLSRPNSN